MPKWHSDWIEKFSLNCSHQPLVFTQVVIKCKRNRPSMQRLEGVNVDLFGQNFFSVFGPFQAVTSLLWRNRLDIARCTTTGGGRIYGVNKMALIQFVGDVRTTWKFWFGFWHSSGADLDLLPWNCQVQNFSWIAFIWYRHRFAERWQLEMCVQCLSTDGRTRLNTTVPKPFEMVGDEKASL